MAKSRSTSKKVKQVAKKSPKVLIVDDDDSLDRLFEGAPVGTMIKEGKQIQIPTGTTVAADGNSVTTGDGYEFAIGENPKEAKGQAIERANKVALKEELKRLVSIFRNGIEGRLNSLSERIENQLKPMVQTVADIAVAKVELENRVKEFEDSLSATLNLNDELEPMDITLMFEPDTALDEEMSTYTTLPDFSFEEEMELLQEVAGDFHDRVVPKNIITN